MKVILKEKVVSLGNIGEVVNVSAGHARNFLFPNDLAVVADEMNQKKRLHLDKILAKKIKIEQSTAEKVAEEIQKVELSLIKRVGPSGKLFGSVTTQEISEELLKIGHNIEKRMLSLKNPIKGLGRFDVRAALFKNVEANFIVTIEIDPTQVEENKKRVKELEEEKIALAEKNALEGDDELEAGEEKKELSEDEKLKIEANKILRSF